MTRVATIAVIAAGTGEAKDTDSESKYAPNAAKDVSTANLVYVVGLKRLSRATRWGVLTL